LIPAEANSGICSQLVRGWQYQAASDVVERLCKPCHSFNPQGKICWQMKIKLRFFFGCFKKAMHDFVLLEPCFFTHGRDCARHHDHEKDSMQMRTVGRLHHCAHLVQPLDHVASACSTSKLGQSPQTCWTKILLM